MRVTEEMMALPLDDFYAIVAGYLRKELTDLEQKLLCVLPGHDFLPGYHAGYKAGVSEIKRRVAALEME